MANIFSQRNNPVNSSNSQNQNNDSLLSPPSWVNDKPLNTSDDIYNNQPKDLKNASLDNTKFNPVNANLDSSEIKNVPPISSVTGNQKGVEGGKIDSLKELQQDIASTYTQQTTDAENSSSNLGPVPEDEKILNNTTSMPPIDSLGRIQGYNIGGVSEIGNSINTTQNQGEALPINPIGDATATNNLSTSENANLPVSDNNVNPPPPPVFTQSNEMPMDDRQNISANTFNSSGGGSGIAKKIIFVILALVLLGGLALLITQVILPMLNSKNSANNSNQTNDTNKPTNKEVALTYWGLWEPNSVLDEIISSYQQSTNVRVIYKQETHKDYRERLQNALQSGTGPDIFRYHQTWLPMLKNDLQPDSNKYIDKTRYFDSIARDISLGGQTFGAPLMYDSLAMYYNPSLLEKAGVTVPKTWVELRDVAQKLVSKDSKGKIQRAGVAMGTTKNIDNFSDIFGLLLMQNGANPATPEKCSTDTVNPSCWGEDAFTFYALFSLGNKDYPAVWNDTLPSSTFAFATEKVAIIFAPSWKAFEIAEINPDLQFKTAPMPQVPNSKLAWSTYWIEGVSRYSKNSDEAWKFLAYLSKDENLTKLYTAQKQLRMFGEIYPVKSLAQTLVNDPIVGSFVQQAEYAKTWFLCSRTFDNGINDRLIKYYEDAINSVLAGSRPKTVMPVLNQGINQVLTQYQVSTSSNN